MKLLGVEVVPGGVTKDWLHVGEDGKDRITTETIIDVEPLLKRNAEEMASASSSYLGSDMFKVASIPGIVLEQVATKFGITFKELMDKKSDKSLSAWNDLLNGREFTAFRTKPGRVKVRGNN